MEFNVKKILVPTDFSEISLNAISYAADIAKITESELIVLHVVETYKTNVDLLDLEDIDDLIEKKASKRLEEIKDVNEKFDGINVTVKIARGKIKTTVIEFAEENSIDLIVMGTTGVSGLKNISRLVLGSNAHRIIQASKCQVVAIPDGVKDAKFDNIILPLDVEKETIQKVDIALRWAKFCNSTVHLISIVDFFDDFSVKQEDMNRQLYEVARKFSDEGVEVKVKSMRYSSVAEAVIDYSNDHNGDLVIIMTRQESRKEKFFLGAKARAIITKSKIPVLSLRPAE